MNIINRVKIKKIKKPEKYDQVAIVRKERKLLINFHFIMCDNSFMITQSIYEFLRLKYNNNQNIDIHSDMCMF